MKRRLLSGIIGAILLVTSMNPVFVSYAENEAAETVVIEETVSSEEETAEATEEEIEVEEETSGEEAPAQTDENSKDQTDAAAGETPEEVTVEPVEEIAEEDLLKTEASDEASTDDTVEINDEESSESSSESSSEDELSEEEKDLPAEEEKLPEKNSSSIIQDITLYKVVDGKRVPLKGDGTDVVASGDTISVKYAFKSPLIIVPDDMKYKDFPYNIIAGREYDIPGLPPYCVRAAGESFTIKSGGVVLGEVTFAADGTAKFKVDENFTEPEDASEAEFQFDFVLNFDGQEDGGDDGFELAIGDTKIPVKVSDFMPQPPKVDKLASEVDENGEITWTVTITNSEDPIEYEDGYSFTDTFSEGQYFVDGSFTVNDGAEAAPEVTVNGSTVSWNYKDNTPGKVTTFKYKTRVDFLALTYDTNDATTVEKTVSNNVDVTAKNEDYGDLDAEASADTAAKKTISEWTTKSGTDVDLKTGEATWTVTINNNGFNLSNVVLHDQISMDSTTEITISDVSVVDAAGNAVPFEFVPGANGEESRFKLGDMPGNAVYTVTYKTRIKDIDKFLKSNHQQPSNKAWITYEYNPTGIGPAVPFEGPGVEKPFGGLHSKSVVEKSAVSISQTEHTMTWKVVANKSAQPLHQVKITDTLPENHEFVKIKDLKIGGQPFSVSKFDVTVGNGTVTIDLGDYLNKRSASFVIVTKLADSESDVWAGNGSRNYKNTVTLESLENEPVSDYAEREYNSTVIEKTAGPYDYSTRTIKYRIVVNKYGQELHDVVVKDQLEDKFELVEDSLNIKGNAGSFEDRTNGNTLELYFEKVTGQFVVEFTVKLRDGDQFSSSGVIMTSNKASVTSKENPEEVTSASATKSVNNRVVTKEAQVDEDGRVKYSVKLNQAQQLLYTGDTKEVKVKDTLGASLVLDESSVKLYTGKVAKDGTITPESEVTGITKSVRKENGKTVLEVIIPKDKDGHAFVLLYDAGVVDLSAGDLSNKAQLLGYGDANKNKANNNLNMNQFTNVKFRKYTYLIAELRDKVDESVLEGGEFQLIDPVTDEVIADKITGKDGQITFVGNLEDGKEYILKEVKAPEGYFIPDELKEGIPVIAKGQGLESARNNTQVVYNEKPAESKPEDEDKPGEKVDPAEDPSNGDETETETGKKDDHKGGSGNNSGNDSGSSSNNGPSSSNGETSVNTTTAKATVLDLPEVLGAYRYDDRHAAAYGARMAVTEDTTTMAASIIVILIAISVLALLFIVSKEEESK